MDGSVLVENPPPTHRFLVNKLAISMQWIHTWRHNPSCTSVAIISHNEHYYNGNWRSVTFTWWKKKVATSLSYKQKGLMLYRSLWIQVIKMVYMSLQMLIVLYDFRITTAVPTKTILKNNLMSASCHMTYCTWCIQSALSTVQYATHIKHLCITETLFVPWSWICLNHAIGTGRSRK